MVLQYIFRIHIGGIITEGKDRGFIEVKPSPYNVVLEDDTYKGEIKIGFKFVANVSALKRFSDYELSPILCY